MAHRKRSPIAATEGADVRGRGQANSRPSAAGQYLARVLVPMPDVRHTTLHRSSSLLRS